MNTENRNKKSVAAPHSYLYRKLNALAFGILPAIISDFFCAAYDDSLHGLPVLINLIIFVCERVLVLFFTVRIRCKFLFVWSLSNVYAVPVSGCWLLEKRFTCDGHCSKATVQWPMLVFDVEWNLPPNMRPLHWSWQLTGRSRLCLYAERYGALTVNNELTDIENNWFLT